MNPHLARIVLRPRGPLQTFDLSIRLLREHSGVAGRLWLATTLPLIIPTVAITWWFDGASWPLLGALLLTPLIQAPFTVLAGRLLFSNAVEARQVLRETLLQRFGPLFSSWLWWLLTLTLSALFCGMLLPITMPAIAYVTECALLERVGRFRVIERSSSLASSHPGLAVSVVAAWVFLTSWGAVVGELGGQALMQFVLQLGMPFGGVLETQQVTPYLCIGTLGVQPIVGVARLLLYVSARTQNEGWDLQVRLRAAGLEPR